MSQVSRFLVSGCLLALAGTLALGAWRQDARMDALTQQLELLRSEVRAAHARAATPSPVAACAPAPAALPAPSIPPEAFAVRVAQLLEERQQARQALSDEAAPEPPSAHTPQQRDSIARAQQLADSILRSGEMRPEEATELRGVLAAVGHMEEARAIRQRLIVASNRGELTLPAGVLPFLP
jgi:hypothetical protein